MSKRKIAFLFFLFGIVFLVVAACVDKGTRQLAFGLAGIVSIIAGSFVDCPRPPYPDR